MLQATSFIAVLAGCLSAMTSGYFAFLRFRHREELREGGPDWFDYPFSAFVHLSNILIFVLGMTKVDIVNPATTLLAMTPSIGFFVYLKYAGYRFTKNIERSLEEIGERMEELKKSVGIDEMERREEEKANKTLHPNSASALTRAASSDEF